MFGELGQPKIQHLHITVAAHHDVFGLDISMHDAGGVGRRQRASYLNGDIKRFSKLHPRLRYAFAQRFAVYELGGNEVDGV
jgi:hypothetical protein